MRNCPAEKKATVGLGQISETKKGVIFVMLVPVQEHVSTGYARFYGVVR